MMLWDGEAGPPINQPCPPTLACAPFFNLPLFLVSPPLASHCIQEGRAAALVRMRSTACPLMHLFSWTHKLVNPHVCTCTHAHTHTHLPWLPTPPLARAGAQASWHELDRASQAGTHGRVCTGAEILCMCTPGLRRWRGLVTQSAPSSGTGPALLLSGPAQPPSASAPAGALSSPAPPPRRPRLKATACGDH